MSIFSSVAGRKTPKSKFNLSHSKKMSMKFGQLVPTLCQEIVPGDNFKISNETMVRFSSMLAPIYHKCKIYTHYFFIPNRIVWDNWEDFITGGEDGTLAPDLPVLSMTPTSAQYFENGGLMDYFGIPTHKTGTTVAGTNRFVSLPFRAYIEIYNEYFRDQNVEAKVVYDKSADGTGDDAIVSTLTEMRYRKYPKDYLTSALPWAQRGPEVGLPTKINYKNVSDVIDSNTGSNATADSGVGIADQGSTSNFRSATNLETLRVENIDDLGVTINDLRKSARLQEWLERQARSGSRYAETILSHFGVMSSDSRLQRPEFLGASANPVTISEVLNTAGDNSSTAKESAVGQYAGYGLGVGVSSPIRRKFNEHGYIIGLTSVLPENTYQDSLPRMYNRREKFDYYWPEFANLGEQEITNGEVRYNRDSGSDNSTVWGYAPRYSEYKFNHSTVHGEMRDSLDFFHLARDFGTVTPALNADFMTCKPSDADRIFAVTEQAADQLYVYLNNQISAVRPMPYYGTPRL